jgi:CheY-like chemotaxis protein
MDEMLPWIFIADDDEDDQFLLQLCFARYSPACRLHFCPNGKELLQDLAKAVSVPTLLLLDLNMPLMGGLETLSILRLDPRYVAMPVIILTTSSDVQDIQQARQLGANDFFTKPVGQEAMGALVTQLRKDWLEERPI